MRPVILGFCFCCTILLFAVARPRSNRGTHFSINVSAPFLGIWEPLVKDVISRANGPTAGAKLDGIRVAEAFPGNDLGEQINQAVRDCGAGHCLIYVGRDGTIRTSPNLPEGYAIKFAPGTYKLSTTWTIKHRDTIYDFSGAQINFTPEHGGPAFLIGKSLEGVANASGTEVKWIEGEKFTDFDSGDHIFIGGHPYNVASVKSPTELVLTANTGVNFKAPYAGYMNPEITVGNHFGSVAIRDLIVQYQGTAKDVVSAIDMKFVTSPMLSNVRAANFSSGASYCYRFQGVLAANLYNLQCEASNAGMMLDRYFAGGTLITSNHNRFFGGDIVGSAGGRISAALTIDGGSSYNELYGFRFEGNRSQTTVLIQNDSQGTLVDGAWFERNGDGSPDSADIRNRSPHTIVENSNFVSSPRNFPSLGIETAGSGNSARLTSNTFQLHYSTSYSFAEGSEGTTEGNATVGAVRNPAASSKVKSRAK